MENTEGRDGQETTAVGSGRKPEVPYSASLHRRERRFQEVDRRRGRVALHRPGIRGNHHGRLLKIW